MGHPGHAGSLVRGPALLPEAEDRGNDQKDEKDGSTDDHQDGQDRRHRELADLGQRALAGLGHPLRLLCRVRVDLGDVASPLPVGRGDRDDVASAGAEAGHGEPRRL